MKYARLTIDFRSPKGEIIPKGTILTVYELNKVSALLGYNSNTFWVRSDYYEPWEAYKEVGISIEERVHELELAGEYADERIKNLLSQVKILPEMISEQLGDMAARIKTVEDQLLEMQMKEVRKRINAEMFFDNTPARPKHRENTLCTYTTTGDPIMEGDILGYGNNYPCVVLYYTLEARFVAVEFGPHGNRIHDMLAYIHKWKILGNIDDHMEELPHMPKNTNLAKFFEQ